MRLVLTASRWGETYRMRHFINGKRVSREFFNAVFKTRGCTPENSLSIENTTSGFRKVWEVA